MPFAKFKSVLPQRGFGRAVAIVTGGTALGQVISIAVSPLLARLFSPSDFGVLAVYTSLTGSIGMVSGLTYQLAIPLPEDDEEAANILILALGLVLSSAALVAVGLLVFGDAIRGYQRTAALAPLLWLVPLGCIGLGAFEALSQWAVRTKEFGVLARASISKGAAQASVQAGWGFWMPSAFGLLFGHLCGQWAGIVRVAHLAWTRQRAAFGELRGRAVWLVAKRFKRFPLLTLPAVLLNAVSFYAPAILLAYFFGSAVAGFYTVQDRVTTIPFRFVGAAAQRVFFASAADAKRDGRLDAFTREVFRQLTRVGLPFVVLLAVSAPSVFPVVFGSSWREAGVYAQWLCIPVAFAMVVFPLTPLNYVLETQWAETSFQVLLLLTRVGSITVGGLMGSARLAIMSTGIAVGCAWMIYLIFLLKMSGNRALRVLRSVLVEVALAAGFAAPIVALRLWDVHELAITLVAAVLGMVAGLVVLRRRGVASLDVSGPSDPDRRS